MDKGNLLPLAQIHPLPLLRAEPLILASRVNQALCDEAEYGRIHGTGTFYNDCWALPDGQTLLSLKQCCNTRGNQIVLRNPVEAIPGSEPLVTRYGCSGALNGTSLFNTPFPYLRMSAGMPSEPCDAFGLTETEHLQMRSFGAKWDLTGNWGGRNMLPDSNWHMDASALTTPGDWWVQDVHGGVQYAIKRIELPHGKLFVPIAYLKKVNVVAPRIVYFSPGNNIAIWYRQVPFCVTRSIMLVYDPDIMLSIEGIDDFAIGCIPGGCSAIGKTDLSSLKNREINVYLQNANDADEVKFMVTLVARLRREFISSRLWMQESNTVAELSIAKLREIAVQHEVMIPQELGVEYLGVLTETLENYTCEPVIDAVLNAGEVISLQFNDSSVSWLLLAHFSKSFIAGTNILSDTWPVKAGKTLTIINSAHVASIAPYSPAGRIQDGEKITDKALFSEIVKTVRVVLIADPVFINQDICADFIQFCQRQKCAVILFSAEELPIKLKRLLSRNISVSSTGDLSLVLSGVEVKFSVKGELLSALNISRERAEQLLPCRTSPTPIPAKVNVDFEC